MLRLSSYLITVDGEDIYFVTDLGVQYQVYLTQGADYIALSFERMPDIVLVYVCDMMDGRQRQRSLLFDRWFREFGAGCCKLVYTNDVETYCGMIFREGHPYTADLKEAVDLYIRNKEAS